MDKIIYSKYSSERSKEFKIRTSIYQNESGKKYVEKVALTEDAKKHIDNIYNNFKVLNEYYKENESIVINKCKKIDGKLEFEYIEGITLDQIINRLISDKDYVGLIDKIKKFRKILNNNEIPQKFKITDEFIDIFGDVKIPIDLEATSLSNVDLIFSNIIVTDKWNIIDYEWVYNFYVPINYIIYRSLYCCSMIHSLNIEEKNKIYNRCGISNEELIVYEKMESKFQEYVFKDIKSTKEMYDEMSKTIYYLNDATKKNNFKLVCYIKDDTTNVYSENKCIRKDIFDDNVLEKICLDEYKNITEIRIDPINSNCIIEIEFIYTIKNGKRIDLPIKYTNCDIKNNNKYIFGTYDPQIYIDTLNIDIKHLFLSYKFESYNNKMIDFSIKDMTIIKEKENYISEIKTSLKEKENYISEIESSRGWKILQMIKKIFKK